MAAMAMEDPLPVDNVTMDHRYRGFVYDLQNPRIPLTGPIRNRADEKKYPLPNSLIRGNPVFPTSPAKGFFFGSENIRELSEEERKENRVNLKLLDKTSADIRKQQRQQEEQRDFLARHREVRKQEEEKKRVEREDDLEMLKTYYPFGKPGYGAPRVGGNPGMTKTLRNENGVCIVIDPNDSPPPRMDWKKTVPIGAPERPRVRRYEDDQMRRYAVSRDTADAYRRELDQLREIKRKNEDKIKTLDKQREKGMIGYDPFGKPGAGAPNRDEKGNSTTRRSISLSYVNNPIDAQRAIRAKGHEVRSVELKGREVKDEEESILESFREEEDSGEDSDNGRVQVGRHYKHVSPVRKENPPLYDPWEKTVPKKRLPRAGDNGIYEFVDPDLPVEVFPRKHIGGGGEPLVGDHGEKITKRMGNLTTIHGAKRTENIPRVATPQKVRVSDGGKSPWGRPGAGAPLTDEEGNVVKNTKGRIDKEREGLSISEAKRRVRAKELYRSQLQEGMTVQRTLRDKEKHYMSLPPGDVPSWFSKGKVGRPTRDPETGLIQPQKRVMSDVTAQKLAADKPRDVESYYKELQEQADERKRMRLKEKERVAQLEAKHFGNFDGFFRRPGHGAPRGDGQHMRKKFSTSAFQAQPQKGYQVVPSHHKTTLQSALFLPYCHDDMKTVLGQDGGNDVTKDKSVDFIQTYSDEKDAAAPPCGQISQPGDLCESCPLRVKIKSPAETEGVTSLSSLSRRATSSDATSDRGSFSSAPAMSENCAQPFPYRVVAPWAIDG